MRYKVAFVTGAPNWHRPELYRKMASHPDIDLTVFFCEPIDKTFSKQIFGIEKISWGTNLLEGYRHQFLKNYSLRKPEFNKTKLFSHLNLGVWKEIRRGRYHAVVLTMWNDVTYWLAAVACKFSKTPLLFAGDSTVLTEEAKPKWKTTLKQIFLGKILFAMASAFLSTGVQNREFYKLYGVPERKIFFFPQSVDYEGLSEAYNKLKGQKEILRSKYKIPKDAFVILFVGRLSVEKRPLDLLKAYMKSDIKNKALVFVGDGKLREILENHAKRNDAKNVYFVGFKPKTEVPNFYALADVLVLPSDYEPHSNVVKEAMCFGLPVIVSDKVGASYDIVKHGENGFVYPCGDTERLASYIDELSDEQKRKHFGERSREIIKDWGHDRAINGLIEALDFIYKARG